MATQFKPRVFLVEPPNTKEAARDIELLENYGDIYTLFTHKKPCSIWDSVLIESHIIDKLEAAAFEPSRDYIAVQGGTILVAHLIHAAREVAGEEPIKGLAFNPHNGGGYRLVQFLKDTRATE